MAKGIGIDMVSISETARLLEHTPATDADGQSPDASDVYDRSSFVQGTFTAAELSCASERRDPASFLAGRLAAKRAARKALGSLLSPTALEKLNPRWVETLPAPSGAPVMTPAAPLEALMHEAGASGFLVSISNESDLAVAMVLVQ